MDIDHFLSRSLSHSEVTFLPRSYSELIQVGLETCTSTSFSDIKPERREYGGRVDVFSGSSEQLVCNPHTKEICVLDDTKLRITV